MNLYLGHKHFNISKEMTADTYFKLNRILLLTVGLWPYHKSKLFTQFQFICIGSLLTTSIIFQLTTLITSKCTVDLIIRVLSLTFFIIGLEIKYISFILNSKTVKCLIEYFQHIYNNLKDTNEIVIIKKYRSKANHFTIILTMIWIIIVIIQTSIQLWSYSYNIMLSVNESRHRRVPIVTEYFIDQEKYLFLLLLHINVSFCIGLFVLLATGTLLNAFLEYACGMFKIASYRIESAMKIYLLQDTLQNKNLPYKGIICGIDIQRKAMMYSKYLISRFEVTFILLIVIGVLSLSLNIFRIATSDYDIKELLIPFFTTVSSLLYMFLSNFIGQKVTDHYSHVFHMAYSVQWYLAPLHIQKLILLLVQRGNKTFGLNVAGLFVASLECFATLANSSISYFIVMYSMQ